LKGGAKQKGKKGRKEKRHWRVPQREEIEVGANEGREPIRPDKGEKKHLERNPDQGEKNGKGGQGTKRGYKSGYRVRPGKGVSTAEGKKKGTCSLKKTGSQSKQSKRVQKKV